MLTRMIGLTFTLAGCGGGGTAPIAEATAPTSLASSSAYGSGALALYTQASGIQGIAPGRVLINRALLRRLSATADTTAPIQSELAATSLRNISGVSIDADHDVGAAFDYRDTRISLFRASTGAELSIYNTQDITSALTLSFGGAKGVYVSGVILDIANQQMIAATSRGFMIIDYQDPARPTLLREVSSLERDAQNGVEIVEHFALHPTLPVGTRTQRIILTGGNYLNRTGVALALIDAASAEVYRPDNATAALFLLDQYIDSIAIDVQYHIALLSDEGAGLTWVDVAQLQLNRDNHTYHLPATAVMRDANIKHYTQIAITPHTHLVFLGARAPAQRYFIAELTPPSQGLGFTRRTPELTMPDITLANGKLVPWFGALEPHGVAAMSVGTQSRGLWMNDKNTVVAIFDLDSIFRDAPNQANYNPLSSTPPALNYNVLP